MILEDFVMLGKAVPEPNSDGRIFVCSAGISAEYGRLIRIYPLARKNAPNQWGKYRVRVERNRKDSRTESFQVAGNRQPGAHWQINQEFQTVEEQVPARSRAALLAPYVVKSIDEANARPMSLAILQPASFDLYFEENPPTAPLPQMVLFDTGSDEPSGARRFAQMPRLYFKDDDGEHRLMLREWGCFELMRKNEHRPDYYLQGMLRPASE